MHRYFFMLILALLFTTSACSHWPAKVPQLDPRNLPSIEFAALKPRSLKLQVVNARQVNHDAGNATAVEQVVRDAVTRSLWRAGVAVIDRVQAAQSLVISINDHGEKKEKDGECVKLLGRLQLGDKNSIAAESYACHAVNAPFGLRLGGDLSKAYEGAIGTLLRQIDRKMEETTAH